MGEQTDVSMGGTTTNSPGMVAVEIIASIARGDAMVPPALNMTTVLAVLGQLTASQLEHLYNVTGFDSREELLRHINKTIMHVKSFEEPFMQFPEFRIKKQLILFVSPILILLGTLGNMFSFIVLRRKPMKKVSSYVYLASLAITDTLVLYIGLLKLWIGELTGYEIQQSANWICKLTALFGYVTSDLSVWLIIAVTVERYIVVCFPFRANSMCNVSRAKKVILFLLFLMLSLNFHFLWTVEVVQHGPHYMCEGVPPFESLVAEFWPWVDAFVYSFFPFVTITALNFLIIREVMGARSNRMLMSGADDNCSSVTNVNATSTSGSENRRHNASEGPRLTVMLVTVSFTFLVLTLPNNISLIVTYFWNSKHEAEKEEGSDNINAYRRMAQFTLVKTITELLMYTNHSINFFLYCATGNKFRQQVLQLFHCLHRRTGRDQTILSGLHSLRRTSHSMLGGPNELMLSKRCARRKSSCVSSELNVEQGIEGYEDSGFGADGTKSASRSNSNRSVTGCDVSGSTSVSISNGGYRQDNSNNKRYTIKAFSKSPSSAHEQILCGCSRGSKRSSPRACEDGMNCGSSHELQVFSDSNRNKRFYRRQNSVISNGGGCRVHFSSRKYMFRSSPSAGKCLELASEECKDNEYVLLEPTIRWCGVTSKK